LHVTLSGSILSARDHFRHPPAMFEQADVTAL
jgi:hypothetical protein